MSNIPIHNWKDLAYYNQLSSEKNLTRWGWEFLRRNPEYQKDFEVFSSFPDCDLTGNNKNGKYKGNICCDSIFYIDAFHYTNRPAYKGETYEEYEARCPNGEIIPYAYYLRNKYHFAIGPLDPKRDLDDDTWFYFDDSNENATFGSDFAPWEIDVMPPNHEDLDGNQYSDRLKKNYLDMMRVFGFDRNAVIIAFDVTQGLDNQIIKAGEILKQRRQDYQEDYDYLEKKEY